MPENKTGTLDNLWYPGGHSTLKCWHRFSYCTWQINRDESFCYLYVHLVLQSLTFVSVQCVAQTWYISVDMQLYLLAPLLLLPLTTHRRGGHLLAVCYVGTTVATLANAYYYELRSGAFYTVYVRI